MSTAENQVWGIPEDEWSLTAGLRKMPQLQAGAWIQHLLAFLLSTLSGEKPMRMPTEMNASQKASVAQWFEMAEKVLDEAAELMDLNLGVCRETMEDMAHSWQSACDVRDLPSAFNWQTRAIKPFVERSAEYGARLIGWSAGSGLQWGRSLEAQWASLGRQMGPQPRSSLMPEHSGSGASMDYLRNAMQAFEGVWDAMRQNMQQAQEMATREAHVQKLPNKAARKTRQ